MKILVFYRSNKYSASVASATKVALERNPNIKGLEVEFANLDKRNYKKVLSNMEVLPKCVYVWYNEEDVIKNIQLDYPTIEVLPFSKTNSVLKDNSGIYPTKEYLLADVIVEKYKESLEKNDVYVVKNGGIFKENMDKVDIASSKYHVFDTKEKANNYCILRMESEINRLKNNIVIYKEMVKSYEKELKMQEQELKKFVESIENELEEREL